MDNRTTLTRMVRWLQEVLVGRNLSHAIARHNAAADNLDAALKELLEK